LDKNKGMSMDRQMDVFEQLILLANEINAPMVIHCVRAFDTVLYLFKTKAKTPWAIHGFARNKVLAKQLMDAGMYISIAPSDKMSRNLHETLSYIPLESVFIESDSDCSLAIHERYAIFANLKGVELDVLKRLIFNNFTTFFKHKWKFQIG
jgi:TatD DNase family protein